MRARTAVPAVLLVLALSGCGLLPSEAPSSAPTPVTSPKPTETAEPDPVVELDDDVLLRVTATATSASGETLDLDLQVRRAVAWSEATESADLMTATCEGSLDNSVYEEGLWSFATVDIEATGSWTGDSIELLPLGSELVALASSGFLSQDDNVDPAMPYCIRTRTLASAGEGALVLGFSGDTDEVGAAGQFTKWANVRHGFVAPDGVTLSDCEFLVTPAGAELNGGEQWWGDTVSESECSTGASAP